MSGMVRRAPVLFYADRDADLIRWYEALPAGTRNIEVKRMLRAGLQGEGGPAHQGLNAATVRQIVREEIDRAGLQPATQGEEASPADPERAAKFANLRRQVLGRDSA